MRVALADLATPGIRKDPVTAGFGSRLPSFSRVARVTSRFNTWHQELPSLQLAYLAAIFARWGHEVRSTRGPYVEADLAIVLSSLVDYRREVAWCDEMRRRGIKTGVVGMASSCVPALFADHADFLIIGEPEAAANDIAQGANASGALTSTPIPDVDALPFPRWDLTAPEVRLVLSLPGAQTPVHVCLPVMASRGYPESSRDRPDQHFGHYRMRSATSVADEVAAVAAAGSTYVVFHDPLFTKDRDRCIALCDEIAARSLSVDFECETALECLDADLIDRLVRVGLRAVRFQVEAAARSSAGGNVPGPVAGAHARAVIEYCRQRSVRTTAVHTIGDPAEDVASIGAAIEWGVQLGTTYAQFKLRTPYPGTPFWREVVHRVSEQDWERFDGFTPTFQHPHLTPQQLRDALTAAYARFYVRPSYLADRWGVRSAGVRRIARAVDRMVVGQRAIGRASPTTPPVACAK